MAKTPETTSVDKPLAVTVWPGIALTADWSGLYPGT